MRFIGSVLLLGLVCGCSAESAPAESGGLAGAAAGSGAGVGTGGAAGGAAGQGGAAGASGGAGWGVDQCAAPAGNVGFEVGDSLGALEVRACDSGAVVSVDELCGAQATWLFVAHTHCPTCKATAGFTPAVAAQVADKDVAIAHIVYNDDGTSCAAWRDAFELAAIPSVRVYEDPTGAAWSALKSASYTAPSVFVDESRVITFKAHGLSESEVRSQIDAALVQ
jgi:thiol-disulfide isomerase/thioredoxin